MRTSELSGTPVHGKTVNKENRHETLNAANVQKASKGGLRNTFQKQHNLVWTCKSSYSGEHDHTDVVPQCNMIYMNI